MTTAQHKEMATRIKKRRELLGFTQESFCELIHLSASSYTKIENAFQRPSLDTLVNIATRLDLSLDYLVFGNEDTQPVSNKDIVASIIKNTSSEKLLYASKFLSQIAETIKNNEIKAEK